MSEDSTRAWRTARVFISSTFRDMQAERDLLVRFVFPRLRDELLKRRVHLIDVDLRWGVTSDEDVLAACRSIIDDCRPRFLCMLGGRYGWVPGGAAQSITHDEIEYGAFGGSAGRASRFFYFRDDVATASVPDALAREFRDSTQNAGRLDLLKQSIREHGYEPYVYSARWDAAGGSFAGLQDFGARVYEDLITSIAGEFGDADAVAADEFADENAAVDAFVESRARNYVVGSRRGAFDRMHRVADEGGIAAVVGEPGAGKSALMAAFWRERLARGADATVIAHFVGASPSSTNIRQVLRRLHQELAAGGGSATEIPTDFEKLVAELPVSLEKAARRGRIVILLDGVNQLRAAYEPQAMRWLPAAVPDGVAILIAAPPGQEVDELRRRPGVEAITLDPLLRSDLAAITDEFLARYQKHLDEQQRTALFAKQDATKPLYLVAALEELRTLGIHEEITRRIRDLPEETLPLFRWILTRLEGDVGFRDEGDRPVGSLIVPDYCALIAASRFGMSQAELVELLSPAGDHPADSLGNIAALHRLLRPYLIARGDLLGFFHRQLEEAVALEYLADPDRQREKHRTLATYFGKRADRAGDRTWTGDARAISELPYHLTHAELWDDVFATLTDFTYLERKAAGVGVVENTRNDGSVVRMYTGAVELLDDYSLALDRFPSTDDAGAPPEERSLPARRL